jgi:colicin import membrane protein
MSRESKITQEQVNAAADSIRAAGDKPAARSIREALGAGSYATVLKFLQVWQARQVRAAETPVTLPTNLQRTLVDYIGQEVSIAKADLQTDLVAAQQANGDLIAESERQASTIELQAEALESSQAEKAELAGRLAQVGSDLARATDDMITERNAAEHARTELAKTQLRLEALPRTEAEADRLRSELERITAAKVAAEQAAAVALAKLEAMADRATKADAAVEKAENQAAAVAQELAMARVQVQSQQVALNGVGREIDEARKQAAEARAEAKKSGEIAAELRGQLAAAAQKTAVKKPATPAKSKE